MKKTILYTVLSILLFSFAVSAQIESDRYYSSRLENLADQLKRDTVDLADRTSEELRKRNSSRNDVQSAFLAQQLDASVGLFQQMLRDRNNRASDLRDAAAILTDLARRAPSYGSNSNLWRSAQNSINDINRELGSNNSGGGNNNGGGNDNGGGQRTGRAYWRGIVDNQVQLVIRNRTIETLTIAGRAYQPGRFSFTTALPSRNVSVEVDKKSGRGDVRVIQQPSRDNGYTAIIQINDNDGGAKEYQLEINW
jgi:hypothetical protein